jgi:hypothetical protein
LIACGAVAARCLPTMDVGLLFTGRSCEWLGGAAPSRARGVGIKTGGRALPSTPQSGIRSESLELQGRIRQGAREFTMAEIAPTPKSIRSIRC